MTTKPLETRVAHLGHGAHRFFGHDLFPDLVGKESLSGLMAMAVLGRRVSAEEKEALDCLSTVLAVADPRIWPLKITRIIGSYGRASAAFCSAQICVDSDVIGMWSGAKHAAQSLIDLRTALPASPDEASEDDVAAFLETRKRLIGFGVPFRARDERLDALRESLERSGRAGMTYWRLQERLSELVVRTRKIGPNIVIGTAAMLLDMGFDPGQVAAMGHFLLLPTFAANAVEAAAQAPAILRRLPDETIDYIGPPPRVSARAKKTADALSVP